MSLSATLLLGLIAGVTIVLGVPIGRLRHPAPALRVFLNAGAVGVLLFLFWDVLSAAWEPIDVALSRLHDGTGALGAVFGYGVLFSSGLSVGLLALVGYERYLATARHNSGRRTPGDTTVADHPKRTSRLAQWPPARRLSLLIAIGIGLHNFAEGLAIGQAASTGAIALATVLVIGFALHNATEGFGIVAPLAGDHYAGDVDTRPGWGFLLAMAAIGGAPTVIGTGIGFSVTSAHLSVLFLTLAAGSIAFVIVQLLGVAARTKRSDVVALGVLLGLMAGFVTDAVVSAGGA